MMSRTPCKRKDPVTVRLTRNKSIGFGLTVTCGDTYDTVLQGAFIESLLPDGPAYNDGNLSPGDHILMVNGIDVRNDQFLDVVDLIKDSDSFLEIVVAKSPFYENAVSDHDVLKNIIEPFCVKENTLLSYDNCDAEPEEKFQSSSLVSDYTQSGDINSENIIYELNCCTITDCAEVNKNCIPDVVPCHTMSNEALLENLHFLSIDDESACLNMNEHHGKSGLKLSNASEVHNCDKQDDECKIYNITLVKKNGSLGLNIFEGLDSVSYQKHIYIHSLISGGAAEESKRISPGDKVLKVNGMPLQNLSYQQVVTVLRESSVITELVIEKGCSFKELPVETLHSIIKSLNNCRFSDDLLYQSVNNTCSESDLFKKSFSADNNSYVKIDDNEHFLEMTPVEPTLMCNSLKNSSSFNCNVKNEDRNFNYNICNSLNCVATDLFTDKLENNLHNDCAKGLTSEHIMGERHKKFQSSFHRLLNLLTCDVDNSKKSAHCTFDTLCANEKFSSPCITKSLKQEQDCIVHDAFLKRPLTICKSTPNLVESCDDEDSSKNSDQRENLLFRNKSTDCLASSLPYFEINLLNLRQEHENFKSSTDCTPQATVRKKKFKNLDDIYNYLNSENTFEVNLKKGTRGFGFSLSGGRESSKKDLFSQLIRIRKLYPLQPALESGKLFVGDIILEVNSTKMVGLTNTEALEILRCASSVITLKVFRPSCCNIPSLSICKDSLPIFFDSLPSSTCSSLSGNLSDKADGNDLGEFKITLMKNAGSLGFTVARIESIIEGQSAGIYVKALIREPAVSDGRIRPGDRIIKVNETDISQMTHTEAVAFLRSASDMVTLTLFRTDPPLSPCDPEDNHHLSKTLRWEAVELLNDRLKNKDDSHFVKKKLQRKINKINNEVSSSSTESSSTSKKNSLKGNSLDVFLHSNSVVLSSENRNMQRCQRPKSLDVLNFSERKQISENEDSFYRQTSVTGALINQKYKPLEDTACHGSEVKKGVKTLLKWRGSSFPNDSIESHTTTTSDIKNSGHFSSEDSHYLDVNDIPGECLVSNHLEAQTTNASTTMEKPMVQTVDVSLNRGWHGRLGFSLRDPVIDSDDLFNGVLPFAPEVKAVYPRSLADKDGRIKVGDRLVEVNSEPYLNKSAVEAIDILRKTRGVIKMVLCRLKRSDSLH